MEVLNPTSAALLGQIVLRDGDASHTISLGIGSFPSRVQLGISEERYREIQSMAVEMTLQGAIACCF